MIAYPPESIIKLFKIVFCVTRVIRVELKGLINIDILIWTLFKNHVSLCSNYSRDTVDWPENLENIDHLDVPFNFPVNGLLRAFNKSNVFVSRYLNRKLR